MKHADDESLALMAMGDTPSPDAADHLRHCARCTRELEAFRHVVATARTPLPGEDELLTPPADLWDAIADELGLAPGTGTPGTPGTPGGEPSARGAADAGPRPATADAGPRPATAESAPPMPGTERARSSAGHAQQSVEQGSKPAPSAAPGGPGGMPNTGRPNSGSTDPQTPPRPVRRPRRLARFSVALAACAALFGAGAGSAVTWWVTHDDTSSTTADDGRRLDSLQPRSAGYARLAGSNARRTLDITVKGLPKTSGYFEVWLMDRSHTKLVSMGVLGPDGHAVLPVPDTIDLKEYSVVDVSVQPYNGKPDHSGDSVVRGPYAG
ncbi:anti-sigma factor [Streptomyces longwoodensis]|uniref:anti-sigma factor n=1 Tax=Streptomyces longwoodensis TaxID=68231 RepID=UPI00382FF634